MSKTVSVSFEYDNKKIRKIENSNRQLLITVLKFLYKKGHHWSDRTNNQGYFFTTEQKNDRISNKKSENDSFFEEIDIDKFIFIKLSIDDVKRCIVKNLKSFGATNINCNIKTIKRDSEESLKEIEELLICDEYISKMLEVKKNDFNISKLLGTNITQQQSIKFGYIFEDFIRKIISLNGGENSAERHLDIYNTGSKNKNNKGKKNIDILFQYNNILYYFECKTNLNLDSEKSKETNNKVEKITKHLKEVQELKVVSGILTCWYEKEINLATKVDNVIYMSDLFKILNYYISSKEYYLLMKKFGEKIKINETPIQ